MDIKDKFRGGDQPKEGGGSKLETNNFSDNTGEKIHLRRRSRRKLF